MEPFTFLHCGDVHLGAPFRGLAEVSPALGARLREAPARAFQQLVTAAIDRRVAAVVVAGDLFDAADRNLRAQIQLRDALGQLHDAGIPSFVAAGNHDPLGSGAASVRYPDSVHLFGPEVEGVPLRRGRQVLAHIYGVSHARAETRDNLAARFPDRPQGPFAIAVLHANVGQRPGHGPYAPCTLAELQAKGFDYWALGHVHRRETLSDARPVVHYPGSPQGLHINETGPRGATLVEVDSRGRVRLEPIWVDRVRWHKQRTPIEDLGTLDELLGAYGELAGALATQAPDRLHILRWSLTGSGPLHQELRRPGAAEELTEHLRAQHGAAARPGSVWLESLELATRPPFDLEALRAQQDLLGDLLRLAHEARQRPPAPPRREIGVGDLGGPDSPVAAALRKGLAPLLEQRQIRAALGADPWEWVDWGRLLARAEVLAVEALAADESE